MEKTYQEHKNDLVQTLIKENIGNETGHAFIKMIYSEHIVLKLFWAISLIGSNAICGYLIIQTIVAYFSFETYTSSKTIFETPTLFPKVTICNNVQFATEYAYHFLEDLSRDYFPDQNIFNESQMRNYSSKEKFDLIMTFYSVATAKVLEANFTNEQKKKLGHSLDDAMFTCNFNNVQCTPDDFLWEFDRYYGNCFVFNSGLNSSGHRVDLKKSYIPGSLYGLQIQFYVGSYEKLNFFNSFYGAGG